MTTVAELIERLREMPQDKPVGLVIGSTESQDGDDIIVEFLDGEIVILEV